MAHQLWISPITGYRRRGTRLSEFRNLLGNGITALTILEPIQSCPSHAAAVDMAEILSDRGFDIAGVQASVDSPVIGFVDQQSLTIGTVSDHIRILTPENLVSDSTPLASLLSVLLNRASTFVLVGSEIQGIVTRADLNKPPVRVYLFGLISLLEMHLAFWILDKYDHAGWQQQLSPHRLTKALELQQQRCARNNEVALWECLQFCDKRDLIVREKELLVSLEMGSRSQASAYLKRAEKLRDLLAHSQYDISGSNWQNLIDLVAWIERVVDISDQLIEDKAKAKSTGFKNALFSRP